MSTWQNTLGLTRPAPDTSSNTPTGSEHWAGAPCTETDPELWYSEDHKERAQAAKICGTCPLVFECAEAGRDEKWGIWGGIDRGEPFRARRTAERARRAARQAAAS